jgi:hypothetical protein
VAVTPDQEQELRAHFQAVLRANRELGPDYEGIAVDQLMERVRASAERTAPPPPRQVPGRRPARGGTWCSPWAILGLIAGAFWIIPALVGAVGGLVAFAVVALVAAAVLRRLFRRWGPWGDRAWGAPGPWRYGRGRSWDG